MKPELLEYLVRHCAREVLSQMNEHTRLDSDHDNDLDVRSHVCGTCNGSGEGMHDGTKCTTCGGSGSSNSKKKLTKRTDPDYDHDLDDTLREGDPEIKGAAAPPADGQGSGDTIGIPNEEPEIPEKPSEPETPKSQSLKGIIIVNPKDKAKLEKVSIKGRDDGAIERELHKIGAMRAGSNVKVAISTIRAVKNAMHNPNAVIYLYLGKYDPDSDEIFLMADQSLQVAKDETATDLDNNGISTSTPQSEFNPMSAGADEFAGRMQNKGQTPVHGLDEGLKSIIKKMVNGYLEQK
jgi:hypothetical protein